MSTDKGQEWLKKALGLGDETPFPWQMELLRRFCQGEAVSSLDIPTGLGKTSVMAIWLVARALKAEKLPRRLVYIVDRRAVVDQATEVAESLRKWVAGDQCVACALGLNGRPLPISTLRGQYVDNRAWLEDPSSPAIIVGTVDMVGSRLLFSGYGVSRRMRPYHAGLLGVDTLVVLDESHLVPPFEHLLRAIETDSELQARDTQCQSMIPRLRLLTLSATGRTQINNTTQADATIRLTDGDYKHPVVEKRLKARKVLRLCYLSEQTKLKDKLAEEAWKLREAWKPTEDGNKAVRILVYADSREDAKKAREAVKKHAKGDKKQGKPEVEIETELFVGGRRVFEREEAKERLKNLGFIAGSKVKPNFPVFLFATSAGEVGVDLDADHMVCDLVAWERMVQRLGRVNRRGDGDATVVIVIDPEPAPSESTKKAIEKRDKLNEAKRKLNELKGQKKSADNEAAEEKRKQVEKDLKQAEKDLKKCLKEFKDADARIVARHEAAVAQYRALRKLLDAIPRKGGSMSPEALLRLRDDPDLADAFRDAMTVAPLRPALTRALVDAWAMTSLEKHTGRPDNIQPWLRGWIENDPPQTRVVWRKYLPVRTEGRQPSGKEIEAFFEAAPPHASEILETETYHVVKWIAARAERLLDPEKQKNTENPCKNDVVAFALDSDGGLRKSFKLDDLKLADEKKEELTRQFAGATLVLDVRLGGLKDGLLDDEEDATPKTADSDQGWCSKHEGSKHLVGFRVSRKEASAVVPREKDWRERFRFPAAVTEDGETTVWLIVEKLRHDAANEEDRSVGNQQLLNKHERWTAKRAFHIAKALNLAPEQRRLLIIAARFHDEGKRAAKWQQAFHAPGDGVYAKTEGPINYQLLDGYRHELGSLLRIGNNKQIQKLFQKLSEEDRDLVLHLITAHHGFARPVIGIRSCEDAPPSALEEKAAEIALRFARLQARWGPWGLAWWEALLRAADQQASRDNDQASRDNDARVAQGDA
ncbi:type I-U CRISPR-associated helicase/endonuclease Cas3 [Chloracidobacterium sp. MS 40/45]|uniref:DEAD/DEAH box helicase n=1 Tax=Chloracidobacterium aggregatum TaxID=2851959 RepID=UPI001B8CCE46|nr:type I-U CRISPR-associated helicase/endonuclease Cas3 [Chloracidobacterium aggregatum]QUW00035.1 type I-U CRISPR-associated helicase/endonuclease Cas3 [Chloracidobacterium sp. MS 40/45]